MPRIGKKRDFDPGFGIIKYLGMASNCILIPLFSSCSYSIWFHIPQNYFRCKSEASNPAPKPLDPDPTKIIHKSRDIFSKHCMWGINGIKEKVTEGFFQYFVSIFEYLEVLIVV